MFNSSLVSYASRAQIVRKSFRFVQSLILMACLFMFSACQKEEIVNPTENQQFNQASSARLEEVGVEGVSFNGEFLEFKNHFVFDSMVKVLSNVKRVDLEKWEGQFKGFVSMKTIFNQALDAQKIFTDALIKNRTSAISSEINFSKKEKVKQFLVADFANKNKDEALLIDEGKILMNIYDPTLSNIVNKNGFVKVGQYLFQYTNEELKVIKGGKEKLNILKAVSAKATFTTNPDVIIRPVQIVNSQIAKKNGRSEYETNTGGYWMASGYFDEVYYPHTKKYQVYTNSLYISNQPIYNNPRPGSCGLVRDCPAEIIGWSNHVSYQAQHKLFLVEIVIDETGEHEENQYEISGQLSIYSNLYYNGVYQTQNSSYSTYLSASWLDGSMSATAGTIFQVWIGNSLVSTQSAGL